jgi:hypothetical protein
LTNGIASFYGCSINVASSSDYTLEATSSVGYTAITSNPFLVGGSSDYLAFALQPSGGAAGATWTQQPEVEALNSLNAVDPSATGYVTLTILTNPANGSLYCSSGTYLPLTNGIASFYGCSINVASSSYYTLEATSSVGYTAQTSSAFYISGAQTPVTITDAIAAGVNRGSSGFGIKSVVVPANGYITLFAQTNPNLAGSHVQVWVESKTSSWHVLTGRAVASDGTVHYYARVHGWTAYRILFSGNTTYAAAWGHGRIATNPT